MDNEVYVMMGYPCQDCDVTGIVASQDPFRKVICAKCRGMGMEGRWIPLSRLWELLAQKQHNAEVAARIQGGPGP